MRRINMRKVPTRKLSGRDGGSTHKKSVIWNHALLMAHIETPDGPDLQVLRETIESDAVLHIEAGERESNHAEAVAIIDEEEAILSLKTGGEPQSSDASIMAGFSNTEALQICLDDVASDLVPAVVLRNYEEGLLHVLDSSRRFAVLEPGSWTIQSATVPDGAQRTGSLKFHSLSHPQNDRETHD